MQFAKLRAHNFDSRQETPSQESSDLNFSTNQEFPSRCSSTWNPISTLPKLGSSTHLKRSKREEGCKGTVFSQRYYWLYSPNSQFMASLHRPHY